MITVPLSALSNSSLEKLKQEIEVELRERDCLKTDKEIGVHATHCCSEHGCKYMEETCPVVLGTTTQRFPCMECETRVINVDEEKTAEPYVEWHTSMSIQG